MEAFKGRGNGDSIMSHDLEDLVAVLDGRSTIVDEIKRASADLEPICGGVHEADCPT